MNEPLKKAAQDAVDAADNAEQLKLIAAVLQAQQLLNAQPQPRPVHAVQRPVGLYIAAGIGGAVALTFLAMAAALLAVAVAVGAICATVCLIVLRGMWAEHLKGGSK